MTEAGQPATLSGGDRLVLRSGGVSLDMGPTGAAFVAEVPESGSEVDVDFVRPSGTTTFTLQLPADFQVVFTSASRATPITVQWTPDSSSSVVIDASGLCLPAWSRTFTVDPGQALLQAADFALAVGDCDITVVVTRSLPSSFGLNSQVRTAVLRTTP